MAKYVLQIVEGPHAGKRQELSADLTIGRRAGCDLVLDQDEKLSGRHCEVVLEGGGVLLRDLDSTNGTRVDGKRVQELPIASGDRFQIGQSVILLVDSEAGDALVEAQTSIGIDAAVLARSRKRSPLALVSLLLLLVGGGAAWWFFLREDASVGPKRERKIVAIPGNLLPESLAQVESDEVSWLPAASGAGFTRASLAKSGKGALVAELGPGSAEVAERLFAVAMCPKPVDVARRTAFRASAQVRTDGRVRVGLRLVFFEKAPIVLPSVGSEEDGEESGDGAAANAERFTRVPLAVTGDALKELEPNSWTTLEVASKLPPDVAEVGIAIVAVLVDGATEDARVAVDEIALLDATSDAETCPGSSSEFAGTTLFAQAERALVRVRSGASVLLASMSALPATAAEGKAEGKSADPALSALAEALALPCPDVFAPSGLVVENGLAKLDVADARGRMVLHVPREAASSYRVRGGDAGKFEQHAGAGVHEACTGLLWGSGQQALLLEVDTATRLAVQSAGEMLLFILDTPRSATLRLDFQEQRLESMRLARAAEAARSEGRSAEALRTYRKIIQEKPFDEQAVRTARSARATMLGEAQNRLVELERDFDEARAFQYDGLFESLLARAAELDKTQDELKEAIAAFRQKVQGRLDAVRSARAERRSTTLTRLADALAASKQERLARVVRDFVKTRLPVSGGAGDGDEASDGGRDE